MDLSPASLNFSEAVKSVELRKPTEEEKRMLASGEMEWFDNTRLVALDTCPTWGMFRYMNHKSIGGEGRAMALEAGSACHEVFAAVRLYDMIKSQPELIPHANEKGTELFGIDQWSQMVAYLGQNLDERREVMAFCLEALYQSGFYDDPNDKRRTMSNLEEACIGYIDRWPWGKYPVWVEDLDDPTSMVGVEIHFELVIEFQLKDGTTVRYGFRGRVDGLHYDHNEKVRGCLAPHENKTASRVTDAYLTAFMMSHQITGYWLAAQVISGQPVTSCRVHAMAIPTPRTYDYGGYVDDMYVREPHHFHAWFQWFWDTTRVWEQFKGNPDEATRRTHSCDRYFRTCSMLPYCTSDNEERETIRGEMVTVEWNPLEAKAGD